MMEIMGIDKYIPRLPHKTPIALSARPQPFIRSRLKEAASVGRNILHARFSPHCCIQNFYNKIRKRRRARAHTHTTMRQAGGEARHIDRE